MIEIFRRPVVWMGSSRRELAAMPKPVRTSFGVRLDELQCGRHVHDSKPLPNLGAGVWELRESHEKNAYRMMYVLSLEHAIYVLHVFLKKSKSGIGLPRPDAILITTRLKNAQKLDREH